jgi:DNA-3-methyladenine glycosylase
VQKCFGHCLANRARIISFVFVAEMKSTPSRTSSQKLPLRIRRLLLSELPVNTVALARFLIGKTLVRETPRGRISGRIIETEAYVPGDAAAHSFRGPTRANRSLFLRRGHAYVYFAYGSSFMMNVSAETDGIGGGVLIRALEPLEGVRLMHRHRRTEKFFDLTRGPGRLASALRIDKRYDGIDLCARGPLWLGAAVKPAGEIGESVRIGISREAHRLQRFYERGNPHVSGPKRLNP